MSFISESLKVFFEYANDERVPKNLKMRVKKLKEMLQKEYGFNTDVSLEERLLK